MVSCNLLNEYVQEVRDNYKLKRSELRKGKEKRIIEGAFKKAKDKVWRTKKLI